MDDIPMTEDENVKPKRAHQSGSESESSPDKQPTNKRRRIANKPVPSPSSQKTDKKKEAAEEKERKREELKRQKDEDAEKRRKSVQELRLKLQEDQRQKDEEKEKKRKEQEELKAKRLEEQRLRDEKKRQKEEEKLHKQQEKEQAEQKKKALSERQSAIMKSFFIKLAPEEKKTLGWGNDQFAPFEVKPGVDVAPINRREPLTGEAYDNLLATSVEASDYLDGAKKIKRERIVKDPMRAKYFHFYNNNRPPYYGTWRKISKIITGRRPFALSHRELHYDIDSDAEWEEEQAEAGEDCLSDVEEGGNENSNETCDDFYVDHGYLSENEESDASDTHDGEDEEQRKRRMDQRALEFNKQSTTKRRRAAKKALTVQIYGLNWQPIKSSSESSKNLIQAVVFDFARPIKK